MGEIAAIRGRSEGDAGTTSGAGAWGRIEWDQARKSEWTRLNCAKRVAGGAAAEPTVGSYKLGDC